MEAPQDQPLDPPPVLEAARYGFFDATRNGHASAVLLKHVSLLEWPSFLRQEHKGVGLVLHVPGMPYSAEE